MTLAESNKTALRVVGVATFANVLGYIDRVCISIVAPQIRTEFHFSETEMGIIFGAFSLSYALFQTPWGIFADKRGVRQLVTAVIFLWSIFTGLTAAAWSFGSMFIIRLLFGVSEAALSPAIASSFRQHVSRERRSTAFGFFIGGGRVGGMIAPLIAAGLVLRYGWRFVFLFMAVIGLLVLPAWLWGFPRNARPSVANGIENVTVLRSKPSAVAALIAVAALYTMMWQFYATWFPTYLMQSRGFSLRTASAYTALPFLFGLLATCLGGLISDTVAKRMGVHAARRLIVVSGLVGSSILLYSGLGIAQPALGSLLIALAAGAGDLILSTLWATAVDIGGSASGSISGLMNCFSNLGGFAAPVLIGWMLQRHFTWTFILSVDASLNIAAAFLWLFVPAAPTPREELLFSPLEAG